MTLNAFKVNRQGELSKRRVLHDFGKETGVDGMTVDRSGGFMQPFAVRVVLELLFSLPRAESLAILRLRNYLRMPASVAVMKSHSLYNGR